MNSDDSSDRLIEEMLSHMKPPIPITDYLPKSKISNFYANRCVFITGSTGFIGKALVEKLVRSCHEIKRIYLLIREKRGKSIEERLKDLIESQYFDRIRELHNGSNRLLEEKLFPIRGDITLPKFGIGPDDMRVLSRECSIVFNSAATIKFSEPIEIAVRNNIYSVGQLVEFCNQLDHLEALIHLSTAYSNCHKRDTIYEIFYEPPMGGDQIQSAIEKLLDIQRQVHVYPDEPTSHEPASYERLVESIKSIQCDDAADEIRSKWPDKLLVERNACKQQKFYEDEMILPDSLTHQSNGSNLSQTMDLGNGSSSGSSASLLLKSKSEDVSSKKVKTVSKSSVEAHGQPNYDLLIEFTRIVSRMSNRPNTYTFTKAISENYLLEKVRLRPDRYLRGKIPVAIIRPSIVGGAWREPIVGLVDNYNGPTSAILSLYTGALQAMPGLGSNIADLVPVDMVSNMVISAGWFLAGSDERGDGQSKGAPTRIRDNVNGRKIKHDHGIYLFNFVSSSRNPLKWHQVTDLIAELAYKYPSRYLSRLPSSYFLEAGKFYNIYDLLNHKLPAYLVDFIKSKLLGRRCEQRSSAVAGYSRIRQMTETLTPFTSNQWRLCDSNVKSLFDCLDEADQRVFHFDVASINWLNYIASYIIGARIYTMRDEASNVPAARRQLERRKQINILLMGVMLLLIYCIFIRDGSLEANLSRWLWVGI